MTPLGRIADVRCMRCGHVITEHMGEGEHPELPGLMPCVADGCECVDFHFCGRSACVECAGTGLGSGEALRARQSPLERSG